MSKMDKFSFFFELVVNKVGPLGDWPYYNVSDRHTERCKPIKIKVQYDYCI